VKVGDVVRFSKEHTCQPGLDYPKDWVGVVIENWVSTLSADRVVIMWSALGGSHFSTYDEEWWGGLGYEPFEVIS